jgi:Fe2+ transport system protein B
VSLAKNESCTAKIHYIQNKAFEDGFDYEFDGFINLNASEDDLMQDAEENESTNIGVGTHFNSYYLDQKRLCFIDTPGVNSALDREHRVITNSVFTMEKFDRVVYVINAQNAGSNDDFTHLRFVEDKVDKDKVVFVLNKLDKFRAEDDSIEESIANIKKDLRDFGYKEPVICPVSAYAGELAKKVLFDFELNEYEKSDFDLLSRKLQSEDYNLYQYYDVNVKKAVKDLKVSGANASENKKAAFELLKASGILELEYILSN